MGNVFSEWLETYFDEVTPLEFYRDIFPAGELETRQKWTDSKDNPRTGEYCGIAVAVTKEKKDDGSTKVKRYSLYDDLDIIERLIKTDDFCLCSPISYAGKERTAKNARFMYALAVDLDRIQIRHEEPTGLISLWNGHIEAVGRVPKPTYIVSSGTGLHLYYVFDKAIPLFHDIAKQLQRLKHDLTAKIWHGTVVDIHHINEIQQESIYQGFRMPGTITKIGSRARAFLTGDRVNLEYLNGFVDEGSRATRYTVKKELTKAKAREKYPEWYERRIVKGEPSGVWHISRNLYDWWKREILEKAAVGHRYWCLMTLAVYAKKCSLYDPKHNPNPVTEEELRRDCMEIMEHFERLTTEDTNHFDHNDVNDAIKAFNEKWVKYPRDVIAYRCGFELPDNHRKYRKQEVHLKLARAVKEVLKASGEMKPEGRPSKQLDVAVWQANHPDGKKSECHRDTGISRPTIDKYWKM